MTQFYTYLWLRADGTPYYAGKGHGNRAFVLGGHHCRPPENPENILIQTWPDELSALSGEQLLINIYGRKNSGTGCLRNLTDGGEGVVGYKHTSADKEKIKKSSVGRRGALGRHWHWKNNPVKHCPACGTTEVGAFADNAARRDGLQVYCRECMRYDYFRRTILGLVKKN